MTEINLKESFRDNRRKLILKTRLTNIADYSIKMINFNKELPLLNIETLIINDSVSLQYDITDYTKLSDCIKTKSISRGELLQAIYSLISTMLNVKNYFLNSNNFFINKDYVFFSQESKDIALIYLPFKDEMDNSYINQKIFLLEILVDMKQIGIESEILDHIIMELRDDLVPLEIIKEKIELLKEDFAISKDKKEVVVDRKKKKKSFFSTFIKEKSPIIIDNNKTIDKVKNGGEKTKKLDYLSLVICDSNEEKTIILEKESYLIGRLEGAVDITVKNSSVGRIHGRIEREEFFYYYIDLESKNGSYVNGERIASNKRYKLQNGDEIKLSTVNIIIRDNRGI